MTTFRVLDGGTRRCGGGQPAQSAIDTRRRSSLLLFRNLKMTHGPSPLAAWNDSVPCMAVLVNRLSKSVLCRPHGNKNTADMTKVGKEGFPEGFFGCMDHGTVWTSLGCAGHFQCGTNETAMQDREQALCGTSRQRSRVISCKCSPAAQWLRNHGSAHPPSVHTISRMPPPPLPPTSPSPSPEPPFAPKPGWVLVAAQCPEIPTRTAAVEPYVAAHEPLVRAILDGHWPVLRSRPTVPIQLCRNLAVPAAGSESLTAHLKLAEANGSHHDHDFRAYIKTWGIHRYIRDDVRCVVMTLRDAALRLESGMRFNADGCNNQGYMTKKLGQKCLHSSSGLGFRDSQLSFPSSADFPRLPLSSWIDALRNVSAPNHDLVVSDWISKRRNLFLTAQADYLRGLAQCGVTTELHFLCTETLSSDWDAFHRRLPNLRPGSATTSETHAHNRQELLSHRPRSQSHQVEMLYQLDEAQRNFVRRCLYPLDTALHRHVCGTSSGNKHLIVPSLCPETAPATGRASQLF